MKHLLTALLVLGLSSGALLAQKGAGCNMKSMPKYDVNTVQTLTGTIVSVDRQDHGNHVGIYLTLATGGKNLTVHVGPEAFLKEKGFELAQGDSITIKASPARMRGADVYVAGEITRGGSTLALRDETGKPVWPMSMCNR